VSRLVLPRKLRTQPQELTRLRPEWASIAEVFTPAFNSTSVGGTASLIATDHGRIDVTSAGLAFSTITANQSGWDTPGSSDLHLPVTFESGLCIVGEINSGNTTVHTIGGASGTTNGLIITPSSIRFRRGSAIRITVTGISPTLEPGEPIFFVGRNGNYRIYFRGERYDSNTVTYGNHTDSAFRFPWVTGNSICLFARIPNVSELNFEGEIERLMDDPYGTLFEPRKIWIPVGAAAGGPAITDTDPAGPFTVGQTGVKLEGSGFGSTAGTVYINTSASDTGREVHPVVDWTDTSIELDDIDKQSLSGSTFYFKVEHDDTTESAWFGPETINEASVELVATPLVTGSPSLAAPALTQTHQLAATGLATSAPALASPELTQLHQLAAEALATGNPTLTAPALTQLHQLAATGLATGNPVLGAPTAEDISAFIDLAATGLLTGAPVLASPALTQTHQLAATGLATGAPALASPTIAQVHLLGANGLATGAPVLGSTALSVFSDVVPVGAVTGNPVLGAPVLTQLHQLVATGLVTGTPVLAAPVLTSSDPDLHSLIAVGLVTSAPSLGAPSLSITTDINIELAMPEVQVMNVYAQPFSAAPSLSNEELRRRAKRSRNVPPMPIPNAMDGEVRIFMNSVRELLEGADGERTDRRDRMVTLADLEKAGVATTRLENGRAQLVKSDPLATLLDNSARTGDLDSLLTSMSPAERQQVLELMARIGWTRLRPP
jgi:hypothetical protein